MMNFVILCDIEFVLFVKGVFVDSGFFISLMNIYIIKCLWCFDCCRFLLKINFGFLFILLINVFKRN